MMRLIRTIGRDDRGAVVVETLFMFVLMITFIAATTRTMKVHANNQQAYMEAHRKALLNVMAPIDVSHLAGFFDPLNTRPEVPTWDDDHLADDLSGMLGDLSNHNETGFGRSKLVAGHEGRTIQMFNTAAFGLQSNPGDIDFEHVTHMMRGPWTFSGFPAAPGSDPFFEAPAVREAIGTMTDEELVNGMKIFGTNIRDFLKMKPIWLKPITYQAAKQGSY